MKLISKISIIFISALLFNSCSGCVKETSKSVTKLVGKAVEGVNEVISEDEGKLAEESTDAAGTVAEGVGRSVDRQLDENTETVATTVGRTAVQSVAGTAEGALAQIDKFERMNYDTLKTVINFPPDLRFLFSGKSKYSRNIETFLEMEPDNIYKLSFDFYDKNNKIVIYKDIYASRKKDDRRTLTKQTFSLSPEDADFYSKVVKVSIKATKAKWEDLD